MTVTAIRCEACDDIGLVEYIGTAKDPYWVPHYGACPICFGSKVERPPQDHDTRETETDDENV